jgi:vacuolar-type H+-ATPase catalytic subunit A/Vma1
MPIDNPFTTAVGGMPGDYGTGKTVLLKEFSNMAKDVFFITFPCYQFENYAQFFNFLMDTINRKIRESKSDKALSIFKNDIKSFSIPVIGGGIEFKESDPAFDPMNRIIDMFESVYKAVDQPTILFFDDFQYYLKTIGQSEVIKQAFTVLTQELGYDIMLTICGDLTTFEGVREPHEPIARFFEPIRIDPLSRDEINDAINTPLELYGYRFTDEAIDRTHELSQGRAYYVQLCAYYGLNKAHNRQITPEDVSTGLRSVKMYQLDCAAF